MSDHVWIKSGPAIHIAERELLASGEDEKTDLSAIHGALGVLTPEQREKATAAHEKRMHEMMSSRHGGSPSGGH